MLEPSARGRQDAPVIAPYLMASIALLVGCAAGDRGRSAADAHDVTDHGSDDGEVGEVGVLNDSAVEVATDAAIEVDRSDTIDEVADTPVDARDREEDGDDGDDMLVGDDALDGHDTLEVDGIDGALGDAAEVVSACQGVCAVGRIVRDHRAVNAARDGLGPVEVVPVGGIEVVVRDDGGVLGRATTAADGAFEVALEAAPRAGIELGFSAVIQDDEGAITVAVLDGEGVPLPPGPGVEVRARRLWAWVARPVTPGGLDFGLVRVTEAMGAGALALIEQVAAPLHAAREAFGAAGVSGPATSLAILWSPTRTPACLACYLPTGWGPVVLEGEALTFARGIFLSGTGGTPHHFTPSTVAHELGHWVMDAYSRFPDTGGAHGWEERVAPPLAWSEGFATFFGQWALSRSGAIESRYFTMQSNTAYWVDIEAIGAGAAEDDASLPFVFPRPSAGGGLAQPLSEAIVAAILWDLWDDDEVEPEVVTIGDQALVAIAHERMIGELDRGAPEPDLVDYLDALVCEGEDAAALEPALFGFPWEGEALCP